MGLLEGPGTDLPDLFQSWGWGWGLVLTTAPRQPISLQLSGLGPRRASRLSSLPPACGTLASCLGVTPGPSMRFLVSSQWRRPRKHLGFEAEQRAEAS